MYIEALQVRNLNNFVICVSFFCLPLKVVLREINIVISLQNAQSDPNYASLFRGRPKRFVLPLKPKQGMDGNLNSFPHSLSEAYWRNGGFAIYIKPEELCSLGCETPRINYEIYNGKPYRYFYAISSDVDAENPGTVRHLFVPTAVIRCSIVMILNINKNSSSSKWIQSRKNFGLGPSRTYTLPNQYLSHILKLR